jgi:hypothetical protein
MHEDDAVGSAPDGFLQGIARVDRADAQGSLRDARGPDEPSPDIEEDHPELLALRVRHVPEQLVHAGGVEDAVATLRRRPAAAPPELEGGHDCGGAGRTDPAHLLQLVG